MRQLVVNYGYELVTGSNALRKNKMPLKTPDPLVTQSKKLSLKFDEVQNITWFVVFTRAAVLQYFGSKTNVVKHQTPDLSTSVLVTPSMQLCFIAGKNTWLVVFSHVAELQFFSHSQRPNHQKPGLLTPLFIILLVKPSKQLNLKVWSTKLSPCLQYL